MDGAIGVESIYGHGSTFWVEFPLVEVDTGQSNPTDEEAATVDSMETSPAKPSQKTVLCIEDNLSNYKVIESILKFDRPEAKLIYAMQGSMGIELAQQHLPDLVLLDLHLPDINGDIVFQRLRENPVTQNIPVVMLSADAMPGQIARLHAAGVEYYLTKPIDLKLFLNVLEEVFRTLDSTPNTNV
jgi:CheY-like chemotaxis protein